MHGSRFVRSDTEVTEPLLRPLFNDLLDCEDLLDKGDTQFARRTFVRASFAFIEANLHWLREQISNRLAIASLSERKTDVAKLSLLFEIAPKPDRQGRMICQTVRLPFLNSCAFILRTGAEQAGVDPSAFFGDNGWNEMQRALAVRHRITHPKSEEDLDVLDSEMDSVREAHRWFFNCLVSIGDKSKRHH